MKKLQFYTLIIFGFLLLFSCKKEHQQIVASGSHKNIRKYAINFSLSGFTQSQRNFSLRRHQLLNGTQRVLAAGDSVGIDSALISTYYYIAYDDQGNEVSRILKTRGDDYEQKYVYGATPATQRVLVGSASYASLQDSLPQGKYTIVFVASDFAVDINEEYGLNQIIYKKLPDAAFYRLKGFASPDVYFKKFNLTVDTGKVNQAVLLDRVCGQLVVNIEDAIPQIADHYDFIVKNDNDAFYLSSEKSFEADSLVYLTNLLNPEDKGKANYQTGTFILNTSSPLSIVLKFYDASNNILVSKSIDNIPIYKNKRTILSGRLFDNLSTVQFTITANQAWDPHVTTVHF
jgi:hypothetical protein